MTPNDLSRLSWDEWDERVSPRPEVQEFDRVVERAIGRRGFLGGALAFGSGAAVMGTAFLKGGSAMAQQAARFAFEGIEAQTDGTVHVPPGYSWKVVARWGDPLFSDAGAFDHAAHGPRDDTRGLRREHRRHGALRGRRPAGDRRKTTSTPTPRST